MDYQNKVESRNRYSFNIKYQGTEENAETHRRFIRFADAYDKVYISALRVLLDAFDQKNEYNCILGLIDDNERRIAVLESEIAELREQLEKKQEKKVLKTFGKQEE